MGDSVPKILRGIRVIVAIAWYDPTMSMRLDAKHAYLMVSTPTLVTCRLLFSSGLDAGGYVTESAVRRPWRETMQLYLEWVGRELGRECYERERRELRYATRGGNDPGFEML